MRATDKELKDTLWKAANKLRGSLSASQYKDVILGLVYLKYASDAQWKSLVHNAESPASAGSSTTRCRPRRCRGCTKTSTSAAR